MSGYQDVPMTRRRAQLLEEYASKLADMLEAAPNDKDLAEWVQSKIDRAAAAIQSAYHYLDQDDESELEKAVGHKYTHRKLISRDPKTGRARYRYYYAEHQGGGISRAKFEAGSAFKLTWKGRRGHFHIDRVEGDKVFITHDSRPHMEPVPVQADELRALLTKQHSKAEQKHVEKRQREVEEIKRRAHRGGLGLALHRLRQAAAQAGVSLPEQYQRKPKKTRAKVAETAREVEAPKSATLINETNFPTLPPDRRGAGFMTYGGETFRETPSIDGALFSFTPGTLDRWLRGKDAQSILEGIYRKTAEIAKQADSTVDIEEEYESLVEYAEKNARRIFHSPFTDEAKKMSFALKDLQEALEKDKYKKDEPPLTILNEILATLNDLSSQASTPRNELKDTAQQIIEDANQEHAERHDEHQEITRFELGEHTHTRTGQKLYTAKQTERVERDEYFRRVAIAKKHGGRYERRYVGGFVFKNAEAARAFALEVEGAAQEAPETSAETVTPHDEHPGADNFETMPEVESAPTQRLRGVLDALSESERLNTINPKNRKRPKEAKGADAKLIKLINELAEDQDPNERRFLKVMASMLQDVKKQYPRSAYERQESRKDRYATIREFIEKKLGVEPTVTAPRLNEILSRPTTPSTRPTNLHSRSIKGTVDQALSSEPTGISLTDARFVIPSKGDLREMLSQEQRLKRAKEDLVSTGAPNFLGQKNPVQDIMYALDRYLNGPYVELGQGRIREMERGLKIALRDSKGEELEQVKDETARFWREWGGEYKRLQEEFARGRTQGQALRNIRPLIPKHALTPEINQQLDQMEQELDQRPVTGHDIARWIDTRDTNQATRDRQPKTQPTTPREQLTATAREVTQGADNFETMPEVESARATTATVRDVQSTLKASRRADKLTSTGRRARASINADKELIEAAQRALDEGYRGMESPAFIPLNERTPRQANYQRLKGALNGFKSSQTLTRGSWTDDHKSLQKKRIKARDQLDEALKELDQIARSQEQAQVSIEDLPPKGQRTVEDAKRFFGEPSKNEATKRVTYERDGHIITGPASGRGKGKFRYDLSLPRERFRDEPLLSGSSTSNEIGTYDTLDEALTAAINQYEPSDQIIDRMIESAKEERERTARRMGVTPPARQALTETTERVTSDQTAEQATTRATPRPSEETLRGSGELDETVRANLQDRAQYLLRMPEDTTKTGRRSKRQKARDGELLLIHRRLQSDAQERLGPTAPRFADYSQLVGMPRADQPENAETRAQFRTALKDAIRELEQATSGQVTKSARPLITYRAQLIQTVERLTAA